MTGVFFGTVLNAELSIPNPRLLNITIAFVGKSKTRLMIRGFCLIPVGKFVIDRLGIIVGTVVCYFVTQGRAHLARN